MSQLHKKQSKAQRSVPAGAERRRHPRFVSLSHATVVGEDALTHHCLVQDLSLSGAQILGAMQLVVGERINLLVHLPMRPPMVLPGRVVRRLGRSGGGDRWGEAAYSYGVSFARLPRLAAQTLREGSWGFNSNQTEPMAAGLVLVVDGSSQACAFVVRELDKIGRRAIAVTNALDAIEWLLDDSQHFAAALINTSQAPTDGLALLTYLAEVYPHVRCLTMSEAQGFDDLPARLAKELLVVSPVSADALTPLLT